MEPLSRYRQNEYKQYGYKQYGYKQYGHDQNCINFLNDDNIIKNSKNSYDFDSCIYNPSAPIISNTISPSTLNKTGGFDIVADSEMETNNDLNISDLYNICEGFNDNVSHDVDNEFNNEFDNEFDNEFNNKDDNEFDNKDDEDKSIGGARSINIFKKSYTMFMLADATDPDLIRSYFNRLDKLGISSQDQSRIKPHISLMEVYINRKNPYHNILVGRNGMISPQLKNVMKYQYFMLNSQMYIVSKKGGYEIMGDFMAKVYTALNSNYITQFRMAFYKYIENKLGRGKRRSVVVAGKKMYVYSYGGMDLIAVPSYYHGKGVWKPHLSLIKLDKIKKSNPTLYSAYLQHGIKVLINALSGVKGQMNQFNMAYHFNSFRMTVI